MTDVVSQKYALDLPQVVRYLLFVRETVAAMIKIGDQMSVSCVAVSHRAGVWVAVLIVLIATGWENWGLELGKLLRLRGLIVLNNTTRHK